MKQKWAAERMKEADFYQLGLFFKKFFSGPEPYGSMAIFHWKSKENIHGSGAVNVVKDGAKIASTASFTPKSAYISGNRFICAEIGDTYTDTCYQRQGMFSLLINQTREDANAQGIEFVYGTPNENSLPGYRKNANFDIIEGAEISSLVLPLKIDKKLRQKKIPDFIAEIMSSFYKIGQKLRAGFRKKSWGQVDYKTLLVTSTQELPVGYNKFWDKVRSEYEFILDRSPESLSWRFFRSPLNYKTKIFVRDQSVVGYLVTRKVIFNNELRTVIADFLFLNGEESILKFELCNLITDEEGVAALEGWALKGSHSFDAFRKNGFFERSPINLICHKNEKFKDLRMSTRWHFTIADSDNV